ncbi:hypothetical protein K469DRAFT_462363, partial [Zopfia rhizophila CBS 207.26]
NELANVGIQFDIDWDQVSRNGKKLVANRVGYRITSELVKIWLCKACHLQGSRHAAKTYNGNRHIVDHLKNVHRIGLDGSLLSDLPRSPSSPWEVAVNVAGANRALSHQP